MIHPFKKHFYFFILFFSISSCLPAEKTAVFIIGMGRSGTSCTAGVLKMLGLDLGSPLASANEGNKKGKFEHLPTIEINQPILEELRAIWWDPRIIEWNHLPTEPAPYHMKQPDLLDQRREALKDAIKEHLKKHFGNSTFFGIKNPELTTLLPLYTQAARELGYTPKIIIVLRYPDETNASLQKDLRTPKRNYFKQISTAYICALRNSQDCEKLVVYFNDLVHKTEETIKSIRAFLPQLKPFEGAARKEVTSFIDEGLKHHNAQQQLANQKNNTEGEQ